jgi:uncharacterized protein (TIGR03437 family)
LVDVSLSNFGIDSITAANPLPRGAGDTFIAVNGVRAPVASASQTKATIQIPWDVQPGTASLVAANVGQLGNTLDIQVVQLAPVILAVTHSNGASVNSDAPATAGEILSIYCTGLGATGQYFDPGEAAPTDTLVSVQAAVSVSFGGDSNPALFAGLAPGLAGVYQVNAVVPSNAPTGNATVNLTVGDQTVSSSINLQN